MNIIDIQDNLKNLPENALMQEFQQPTGNAPQFLILGELKRRKQMREDYQRQQNSDMKTVAEETITGAGVPQEGIMQMSRAMTPKTNTAQNTGIAQATPVQPTQAPQPQQPQMMSDGGVVRFANGGMSGGTLGAIASLKVNHPNIYEMYKDDDDQLLEMAQLFQMPASEDNKNYFETLEAPRKKNFFNTMTGFESGQAESSMFNDPTAGSVRRALAELEVSQPDRIKQAMDASQANLAERGAYLGSDMAGSEDPIFSEGSPVEYTNETPEDGLPSTADVMTDTPTLAVPSFDTNSSGGYFSSLDAGSGFTAGDENISASLPKLPSVASMPPASGEMDSTYQQIVDANNRQDMMERMVGLEPNEEIYTSLTDRKRAALADPNSLGVADGFNITDGTLSQFNDIVYSGDNPSEVPDTTTPMDRINTRAAEYYQGDLSTPREDVYNGSIYEMLTLQEESELDKTKTFDDIYKSNTNDEQDQETNMFDADLAELTPVEIELRRQDEARRMKRINEIPERPGESGIANFIGDFKGVAKKYFDARARDIGTIPPSEIGPNLVVQDESRELSFGENFPSVLNPRLTTDELSFGDNASTTPDGLSTGQVVPSTATQPGGASKVGSTSTTGGGVSGRIAKMLQDREKSAESDKWMALAQTGLALMASSQPTIGGAIGEAGLAGIGAMQQSRKSYDDDILDLLNMQSKIDMANQRSRSTKSNLTAGNMISYLDDLSRQKGELQESLDEVNSIENLASEEEKKIISDRLKREIFQTDLELKRYRSSLRGSDGASPQSIDVRGGSQNQGAGNQTQGGLGYSLGTPVQ